MILTKHEVEDTFKGIEIDTRQELEQIAEEENLAINWTEFWQTWDSLVEQAKQDITNEEKQKEKATSKVYALTPYSIYLQVFESAREAGNAFGISPEQVNQYCRIGKPYKKGKVMFLRTRE